MLKQGVHPKIVQERLGHAKVGTTLDIYSHVVQGLQEATALRFEEGLINARPLETAAQPVLKLIGVKAGVIPQKQWPLEKYQRPFPI